MVSIVLCPTLRLSLSLYQFHFLLPKNVSSACRTRPIESGEQASLNSPLGVSYPDMSHLIQPTVLSKGDNIMWRTAEFGQGVKLTGRERWS